MKRKALSLHQPWASRIATGQKTIETRFWHTLYRGDFLVCAAKRPKVEGLPTGVAVCIVELVGCRPMTWRDEKAAMCHCVPGLYAWDLDNIRPIVPFAVTGHQGWFDVKVPENMQQAQEGQKALFE